MSEAIQSSFDAAAFYLTPRPALAGQQPLTRNGFAMAPVFGGHVLHVLAKGTDNDTDFLRQAVPGGPYAVRVMAPGQFFVLGDETLSHADVQAIAGTLRPRAYIVDQSHGRVRIALHGRMAETVLAKGTAVDLALKSFPVGSSAMTLIGHIGAHITRVGDDRFEVIALRGFAESLWDDLDHMSREFI